MIICIIKTAITITIKNLHDNNITIVTNNNITIYMNKIQAFNAL